MSRSRRTHLPVSAEAADALRHLLAGMGSHVSATGATTNLVHWFTAQPPQVVDAILRSGGGGRVENPASLQRLVRFAGKVAT